MHAPQAACMCERRNAYASAHMRAHTTHKHTNKHINNTKDTYTTHTHTDAMYMHPRAHHAWTNKHASMCTPHMHIQTCTCTHHMNTQVDTTQSFAVTPMSTHITS